MISPFNIANSRISQPASILILGVFCFSPASPAPGQSQRVDSTQARQMRSTQARISFLQPAHAFGEVPRRQTLVYSFPFGVSKDDSLRVVRTGSSCGCTLGKIAKQSFGPGDTGSVQVSYRTGDAEGSFNKSFTITTNSAVTPEVTLNLTGTVIRCVWADPPMVNLEGAQVGAPWSTVVTTNWRRWKSPGFKAAIGTPPFLKIGALTRDRVDTTLWRFTVTLAGTVRPQYYQDSITVGTSDTAWPRIVIPVQGTVGDIVLPKPPVVNMGQVHVGSRVSNSFLIVASVAGAAIADLSTTRPYVVAEKGDVEDNGRRLRVNLHTDGLPPVGSISTDVMITVQVAKQLRHFKVPIVGRFVN